MWTKVERQSSGGRERQLKEKRRSQEEAAEKEWMDDSGNEQGSTRGDSTRKRREKDARRREAQKGKTGMYTSHGTASKTCVARRRPISHEVQVCVAASPTCHSPSHHPQQPHLSCLRVSLESAGAQQLASSGSTGSQASESNCAHFLDARLELFWAEDWSALWAMARAECDVAPVQNGQAADAVTCSQSCYICAYW